MRPPLLLIADDDRDTRDLFATYLRMVGYTVETAADGQEAVEKAILLRPDLIVMDLEMPEVDGWKAMGALRLDPSTADIPFIILTGHDLREYLKTAALAVGARSYLMKPCLPERLEREIAERLRNRRPTGGHEQTATG